MEIIRVQSCSENPFPFSQGVSTVLFLLTNSDTWKLVSECNKQGQPWQQAVWGLWSIFAPRAHHPALLLPCYEAAADPPWAQSLHNYIKWLLVLTSAWPEGTQNLLMSKAKLSFHLPPLWQHPGTKLCSSRWGWEVKCTVSKQVKVHRAGVMLHGVKEAWEEGLQQEWHCFLTSEHICNLYSAAEEFHTDVYI